MNIRKFYRLIILGLMMLFILPGTAAGQSDRGTALGTGFTYQGQLKSEGLPYSGTCDFQFGLYDTVTMGSTVGEISLPGVSVSEGLFTVQLDFGSSVFTGEGRWLEIWVRCPADIGDYQPLYPRQPLTAAPYALYAPSAGAVPWSGITNVPTDFADGVDNVGWSLTGNVGTAAGTNYLGTSDEQSLEIKVNNQRVFRYDPHGTSPNLIGGYFGNWVTEGVWGATISGGGQSTYLNRVTDHFGTIGGGSGNQAGNNDQYLNNSTQATVNGGHRNTASGNIATVSGGYGNLASEAYTSIGGGLFNTASGYNSTVSGGDTNTASGYLSTVSGGDTNTASGYLSTVSGGINNVASGYYAIVPGGNKNTAAGSISFAAGYRAKANNNGCFVWGDYTPNDLNCDNDNRWIARASGGVYFYTNSTLSSGMYLPTDGSAWLTTSSRDLKENFTSVDSDVLLERLSQFPITTWNYRAQNDAILHVGMMADEFNSLIEGLGGEGQDYINSMDAVGVSLAAAQGLYAENQDLKARVDDLEARLEKLERNQNATGSNFPFSWLFGFGLLVIGGVYIIRKRPGGGL